METTALPKNVGIETMQITYTKENLRLTIGYRDGIQVRYSLLAVQRL